MQHLLPSWSPRVAVMLISDISIKHSEMQVPALYLCKLYGALCEWQSRWLSIGCQYNDHILLLIPRRFIQWQSKNNMLTSQICYLILVFPDTEICPGTQACLVDCSPVKSSCSQKLSVMITKTGSLPISRDLHMVLQLKW